MYQWSICQLIFNKHFFYKKKNSVHLNFLDRFVLMCIWHSLNEQPSRPAFMHKLKGTLIQMTVNTDILYFYTQCLQSKITRNKYLNICKGAFILSYEYSAKRRRWLLSGSRVCTSELYMYMAAELDFFLYKTNISSNNI